MKNMELAKKLAIVNVGDEWKIEDCEELCMLTGLENEWEQADGESFERVVTEAIMRATNELAPFAISLSEMPFDRFEDEKGFIHATGRAICTEYGVFEDEYEDSDTQDIPTLFYENEEGEWGVA